MHEELLLTSNQLPLEQLYKLHGSSTTHGYPVKVVLERQDLQLYCHPAEDLKNPSLHFEPSIETWIIKIFEDGFKALQLFLHSSMAQNCES